jgi:hypothetical protein
MDTNCALLGSSSRTKVLPQFMEVGSNRLWKQSEGTFMD